MNLLHLFHTTRSNSKCIHPIVKAISKIQPKIKSLFSNNKAFIIRIYRLPRNVEFILHWWIWANKKCDSSKNKTEQSSYIGKNNIYLSNCSCNWHSFCGSIEINSNIVRWWNGDWICLKAFNITPTFYLIILIWKRTWISSHSPLCKINKPNCSYCLSKSHEDIFLNYITNSLLIRRSKDSIY